MWALAQCSDLVKEYQEQFNIEYELMIHSRVDVSLSNEIVLSDLNPTSIFAIGSIEAMHDSMTNFDRSNMTQWEKLPGKIDLVPYGLKSCH